jgi:hypothetical protein
MPNISETSLSDISLSRACTVMIIFFPVGGKSLEVLNTAGRFSPSIRSIHCAFAGLAADLLPRVLSIEELSIVNDLSSEVELCGRDDRKWWRIESNPKSQSDH